MNIKKWISVFGEGIDKKLIEQRVTSEGNHLWHIFTWGNAPCLEGDEAKAAFDALEYTEAIRFCGGFSNRIKGVCTVGKLSADDVNNDPASDVYIVASDFSWTYVRTHEDGFFGPYFALKNKT